MSFYPRCLGENGEIMDFLYNTNSTVLIGWYQVSSKKFKFSPREIPN